MAELVWAEVVSVDYFLSSFYFRQIACRKIQLFWGQAPSFFPLPIKLESTITVKLGSMTIHHLARSVDQVKLISISPSQVSIMDLD